jgi:inorganic pyrophosphatase
VVVEEPTFPGCILPARPIGTLLMTDKKGKDEKILAVPVGDPRFDEIVKLGDLPKHWLKEIENFFGSYKDLENDEPVQLGGWRDVATAWSLIEKSRVPHKAREGRA